MTFSDLSVGAEFISNGAKYRKCSEKKAHLIGGRDGAGPLRFRPETEVTEPPNEQAVAQAAKAEQAKKEADEKTADNKSAEKAKKDK